MLPSQGRNEGSTPSTRTKLCDIIIMQHRAYATMYYYLFYGPCVKYPGLPGISIRA